MKKCSAIFAAAVAFVVLTFFAFDANAQTKKVNVRFKPGTSGGTYSNTVTGYGTVDFYLKAGAGQTMSVKLTSPSSFLYFVVRKGTGDGDVLGDDVADLTEWSGELPEAGTYVVRVYLVRAEARRNRRPASFKVKIGVN
jgi:hypothetical protein